MKIMNQETLVSDAIQNIKTMILQGIPTDEIVWQISPEIPVRFRMAIVTRIQKNLNKI